MLMFWGSWELVGDHQTVGSRKLTKPDLGHGVNTNFAQSMTRKQKASEREDWLVWSPRGLSLSHTVPVYLECFLPFEPGTHTHTPLFPLNMAQGFKQCMHSIL